jgi:hypothetical protein
MNVKKVIFVAAAAVTLRLFLAAETPAPTSQPAPAQVCQRESRLGPCLYPPCINGKLPVGVSICDMPPPEIKP